MLILFKIAKTSDMPSPDGCTAGDVHLLNIGINDYFGIVIFGEKAA